MAETLERLTRRSETMHSIRGIVRTMKTMSAVNAAPFEQAAQAIEAWHDVVLDGLHGLLACTGPLPQAPTAGTRAVLVVLGSDHGLCGAYNEAVARAAAGDADAQTARILCVGAQMEDALHGEGLSPEPSLLPPASADGLSRLAGALVTRIESLRQDAPGDLTVTLYHMRRGDHGLQAPAAQPLLPVDAALMADLAARPWASRSLPQLGQPAPQLAATLIRDLLFATLHRAAAEALVTENAARLSRMQQAERAADERLQDLSAETRQIRQAEITTELLDVITGFEALRHRRTPPPDPEGPAPDPAEHPARR